MRQNRPMANVLARVCLDVGLTTTMLALFSFHLTGLALHEWLGLGLCVLIPTHLLVSWDWLAATTRRLVGPLPWRVRLTYLLNAALFVSIVVVTLTGLVISEAVLPGVFPRTGSRGFWRLLHTQSSNASIVLMGLHLGLYWRAAVNLIDRLGTTAWRRAGPPAPGATPSSSLPTPVGGGAR